MSETQVLLGISPASLGRLEPWLGTYLQNLRAGEPREAEGAL